MHNIFRMGRTTNFKLGTQMMEHEDPYHQQAPSISKVKGQGRKVTWSVCCLLISQEWKVPETPKLVGRLLTPQAIRRTSFKVKRSKVKVTRPINAEIKSVPYFPNGKAYELRIPNTAILPYSVVCKRFLVDVCVVSTVCRRLLLQQRPSLNLNVNCRTFFLFKV